MHYSKANNVTNMTHVNTEPFENHYVIQKELGRGKFATVYQCETHTTKEKFAAKIIQTKSAKNMEESLNEVEILRSVDHVGIVKCIDVFQSKNSLTMILELIGGGELFEKLANEDHVSEGQAASYTKQVLEALEYLHSLKIAHLDLKPENLMLSATDSDIIKIVDFGLAKRFNKRIVCMQGTAEFVPPEVISLDPLGAYSDMWAIGVIVYIMVSGYSPFMGDDDNQTYGNISMCEYEFYEEEFANISEDCKDFIKNLFIIKPSERQTATAALNHPWIMKRMENKNCLENQKIKKFLAQRRWRALHKTIQSTRIFNAILTGKRNLVGKVSAPTVNMDHRKLMVADGDSVSITAHISEATKPDCTWSKDGTALMSNATKINIIQSDTQSVLVVSKFTSKDEGHYTIACTNPAGTATATIQLITLAPTAPCVSFERREVVGNEGDTVQLTGDLVANPKPVVVWENKSKKDVAKKSERFTSVEEKCSATLTITKLKLADAGNYTLKARNKLGRGAASVQLKVNAKKGSPTEPPSESPISKPNEAKPAEPAKLKGVPKPTETKKSETAKPKDVSKPEAPKTTEPKFQPSKRSQPVRPPLISIPSKKPEPTKPTPMKTGIVTPTTAPTKSEPAKPITDTEPDKHSVATDNPSELTTPANPEPEKKIPTKTEQQKPKSPPIPNSATEKQRDNVSIKEAGVPASSSSIKPSEPTKPPENEPTTEMGPSKAKQNDVKNADGAENPFLNGPEKSQFDTEDAPSTSSSSSKKSEKPSKFEHSHSVEEAPTENEFKEQRDSISRGRIGSIAAVANTKNMINKKKSKKEGKKEGEFEAQLLAQHPNFDRFDRLLNATFPSSQGHGAADLHSDMPLRATRSMYCFDRPQLDLDGCIKRVLMKHKLPKVLNSYNERLSEKVPTISILLDDKPYSSSIDMNCDKIHKTPLSAKSMSMISDMPSDEENAIIDFQTFENLKSSKIDFYNDFDKCSERKHSLSLDVLGQF